MTKTCPQIKNSQRYGTKDLIIIIVIYYYLVYVWNSYLNFCDQKSTEV